MCPDGDPMRIHRAFDRCFAINLVHVLMTQSIGKGEVRREELVLGLGKRHQGK